MSDTPTLPNDPGVPGPSQGGYETPGANPDDQNDETASAFAAPSAEALGGEAANQISDAAASEFGADLIALKAEIEKKLCSSAANAAAAASVQEVGGDNIVGVGLTMIDAEHLAAGAVGLPGQPGLAVYTVEQVETSQLYAEIAAAAGTRAFSEAPIVQVPVGIVDAYSHRMRMRPAPGGISLGHFRVTAGTLGCLAIGNSAPRSSRLMVLSNNHVIANSNDARLGDCISQPGAADGGACPADQVAILERFIPIRFGGGGAFNYVDAATGWAWPTRVRRELMYLSGGVPRFFRVGANPIDPAVSMLVGKSGRTTQLRQGRINAIGVTVNVNYGAGRIAQFRDQFSIRGLTTDFSAGGDSGSLIWQWAAGLRPVGLLFAGGGGTTFANPIRRVLSALDVRLFV